MWEPRRTARGGRSAHPGEGSRGLRPRAVRDNVRSYGDRRQADCAHRAVGPRVRALREAMDLSLRDLAERSA